MSTKYVVAAAALATVAITQTEATRFSIDQHKKILPIRRPTPVLLDEEQADWNFNAGIQGGAGGRPQWNVGIGAKWDEEEEQKLRLKKVVNAVKRVNNVVNKAQQVGLLDEEQADWNFNAGIQGGAGGKPQWQVGIGAKWDEEQGFGSKLDNTLDRIGRTIDTWDRVKGLFDEEQAAERMREVLKARQAALKIKKTIAAAAQHKLLDEDEEQGFGSKLDKLLGRIDNTMNTIDRVKGVFN